MGQIANQMFIEWCHKMARKIEDSRKSRKDKRQKAEESGKKERRQRVIEENIEGNPDSFKEDGTCS